MIGQKILESLHKSRSIRQNSNAFIKKRTEIERTFARLDRDLGFENHTIRGKKKMNLFVTLAYIVMNGYAVGKLLQGEENIRSLRAA